MHKERRGQVVKNLLGKIYPKEQVSFGTVVWQEVDTQTYAQTILARHLLEEVWPKTCGTQPILFHELSYACQVSGL